MPGVARASMAPKGNLHGGWAAWRPQEPGTQQRWVPARPSLDEGQLAGRSGRAGTQANSLNLVILSI